VNNRQVIPLAAGQAQEVRDELAEARDPQAAKRNALRRLKPLPEPTTSMKTLPGQPLMLSRIWGPRPPTKKSKSDLWNYAIELVDGDGVVHIVWSNHKVLVPFWEDDDIRTALEGGVTFMVQFDYTEPEGGAPYFTLDFLEG
jgi:hypothetical protein